MSAAATTRRLLPRAALPTVVVGVVATGVAWAVGGRESAVGAAVGTLVVGVFFGLSLLVMRWTADEPLLAFAAALGSYAIKVVALALALALLRDVGWLDRRSLGITVVVCALVWVVAEAVAVLRDRQPVVEPVPSPRAGQGTVSDTTSAVDGLGFGGHKPR